MFDQFNVDMEMAVKALRRFKGIGRRSELIGEKKGIKVYDDYAHHPTAVRVTLEALRGRHKKEQIIAVIEPHSFSRTKELLSEYKGVFGSVNKVIIGPIFKARDREDFGITGKDIVKTADHGDIVYLDRLEAIIQKIKDDIKARETVIIVMGAGNSYLWAKNIYDFI